jgi:hypothetical protein
MRIPFSECWIGKNQMTLRKKRPEMFSGLELVRYKGFAD